MSRTVDDRGLAALTEVLHELHSWDAFSEQSEAADILGDRAVFWPTGTDEYRELIRQYQAEIERLQEQISRQAAASPELAAALDAVRPQVLHFVAGDLHPYTCVACRGQWWNERAYLDHLPTCPRDKPSVE